MRIKEKMHVWKPAENLGDKFHMLAVNIDINGFRITLARDKNPNQGVILDFHGAVRSYRVSDDLLSMHLHEGPVVSYKEFIAAEKKKNNEEVDWWAFFKVENSDYLKWAFYQSDGVSEDWGVVHYAICTEDWIIDVLSWAEPEIKFIDIEQNNDKA